MRRESYFGRAGTRTYSDHGRWALKAVSNAPNCECADSRGNAQTSTFARKRPFWAEILTRNLGPKWPPINLLRLCALCSAARPQAGQRLRQRRR